MNSGSSLDYRIHALAELPDLVAARKGPETMSH